MAVHFSYRTQHGAEKFSTTAAESFRNVASRNTPTRLLDYKNVRSSTKVCTSRGEPTESSIRLWSRGFRRPPFRSGRRCRPVLPWPTSSSTPRKSAGEPSTHRTWSPSSVPALETRQVGARSQSGGRVLHSASDGLRTIAGWRQAGHPLSQR
jgi:hypothetical protein